MAIGIAFGAILWQAGVIGEVPAPEPTPIPAPTPTPTPAPTPVPRPTVVELKVTPSKESYSPGEEVVLDFAFTNVDSVPVTIEPFPPRVDIGLRPLDGIVRSFGAGSDDATLLPGETLIHRVTWDQRDDTGEQVSPGRWYHISVGGFGTADWTVGYGWTAAVLIEWPQGAMEKTVYVDAECVVDGVGVALRRVEMERDGVSVIALTRLPEHYGASPPPSVPGAIPAPPPPEYFAPARAQYTVDDVVFDAGYAGFRGDSVADRLWLIWYGLDPVPADAVELTFSITALGDVDGPWEFTIPLD